MPIEFKDFLSENSSSIDLPVLIINLVIAACLAAIIAAFYAKFGTTQSNRRAFATVFIMVAVTTTLVITVVKSSLALSLGLVGALSIVRFRSAIKEPEELAFLFLVIAIGLGLGAGQQTITVVAIFICILCFWLYRKLVSKDNRQQNFYLTIRSEKSVFYDFKTIEDLLVEHTKLCVLKRSEQNETEATAVFYLEFSSTNDCIALQKMLETKKSLDEWTLVEDVRIV